jgi:hypothetical protein
VGNEVNGQVVEFVDAIRHVKNIDTMSGRLGIIILTVSKPVLTTRCTQSINGCYWSLKIREHG